MAGEQVVRERGPWKLATRIAFRFVAIYLVLYCWPSSGQVSIFDAVPKSDSLTAYMVKPVQAMCLWVAHHMLHATGEGASYHPTGSGDTLLNYVQVLCFLLIAASGTVVWSVFDRKSLEYRTMYAWLRLLVRYTLAFTLISYGFAKVFPLQFGPPGFYRLTETYGDSSPMGLLWTFMGASIGYTIFSGSCEVLGGLLLLFKRTTTLGAMVAAGVMLNVFVLNLCYDVPVKLYSGHLLAMALFLLLPDMRGLFDFLVLRRVGHPHGVFVPRPQRKALRIAAMALKVFVIFSVLYSNISQAHQSFKEEHDTSKRPEIYGMWTVDSFKVDGQEVPMSASGLRWKEMMVEYPTWVSGRRVNGGKISLPAVYHVAERSVTLSENGKDAGNTLKYERPDGQHLVLSGMLDGKATEMRLTRLDDSKYLLTHRGFHWVSEYPFNK